MSKRTHSTPSYRRHKRSNQAVVTIDGRDIYLGCYDSAESRAEYDRIIAEWLTHGRRLPEPNAADGTDLTINELAEAYLTFADEYYVKHGRPTTEPQSIRVTIRPLRRLYGHTLARDFGPLRLKAVRQAMVDSGLCRNEVNKRARRIVRLFAWAVESELVPPSVHHGLKAVKGLEEGRSGVRESKPVKPVPDALVDAIEPHVSRQVWAMIQLQRLTGMRPQEVCLLRTCDLEMSGRVWVYTPREHKTEHHGRERRICFGPQAQEVVRPWLRAELTAPLFSPREAMERRWDERRLGRKTPVTPSQKARKRKSRPKRSPSDGYDTLAYAHAMAAACRKAFPHPTIKEPPRVSREGRTAAEVESLKKQRALPSEQAAELREWRRKHHWHPNQLRHNAATLLRKEFGLDVARAVLGHSSPVVTEVYAEMDMAKAAEAMERVRASAHLG